MRTLLLACACVIAIGCGESHVAGDVDSGGPDIDGGPGGTPDSSVAPGLDGGLPADVDGGTPPDVDGGPPIVVLDGGPGPDGGGPPTGVDAGAGGVACGTETCVDPQICCVIAGSGGIESQSCTAADACDGIAAACDGPEDCASGEVCCGMRSGGGGGGGGGSTSCVTESMCSFGRLCHADADCSGSDTCCAFMGVSVCSPFCPG